MKVKTYREAEKIAAENYRKECQEIRKTQSDPKLAADFFMQALERYSVIRQDYQRDAK